ncbi:NAD(P)-dependent oxidoreductase [Microbacterium sp. RD1]|uniref:NAD(P)-dependent oxidoreductase n=1 Tax=Microbacterium sp. RD1 TaxID=3457313 RepID=UPI003FA57613
MAHVTGPVGFLGLGVMGQPMARNLVRAGVPLVVWNRTRERTEALRREGAEAAEHPAEVFARCAVVILMLADEAAVDAVLEQLPAGALRERTVVFMGTIAPRASRAIARRVERAGGRYVEAPVSGSRVPAENATLVGMLAGEDAACDEVEPLLQPLCSQVFRCGAVPAALEMKLAVNVTLITLVTGLAESFHFAERAGIDAALLRDVLAASPMASPVARIKADKLVAEDWSVQAAIPDVGKNARLIADAARDGGTATPLIDVCVALYDETSGLGHADADMAAVIAALRARTKSAAEPPPRT